MKFILVVYLFTHTGDFLWKDTYITKDEKACVAMAQKVTPTFVNTGNSASFFCISKEDYELEHNLLEGYESNLNPIDEHDGSEHEAP